MEENYLLFTALKQIQISENQKTIIDCFLEQIKESDRLDIVVGYCSKASLEKLDELINQTGIKNVCLVLGMYYLEGFPKTIYEKVVELNEKWIREGVGEIRLTHSFKDHNKLYCFYKDEQPISAILGTANLSFLEGQGIKQKQFEMATLFKNEAILEQISFHISQMKASSFSENISYLLEKLQIVEDELEILRDEEEIDEIGEKDLEDIESIKEEVRTKRICTFKAKSRFVIPLKVPSEKNKFNDQRGNYTKSNLNACYGLPPRKGEKARSWWEIQIMVSKKVTKQRGYPRAGKWFYVLTDDGKEFKACVTGDNGRQFVALGDEQFLGRWIKGRLASKGLVKPIEDVSLDVQREGMITKEILEKYGMDKLVLMNTGWKEKDKEGILRNVWYLSFSKKANL